MIRWDAEKDRWLRKTRGISFQEIADRILNEGYIDILEHPVHAGQEVFVLRVKNYIWAVPFVIEEDNSIFLKTAYPSRKLFKRYGGSDEKTN
ncbi:MAG: BrnT family toxin [Deltaproteobacteria bacterium]|nr:BrnT family toxin [Deltaproteobacteria bacterium]